MFLGPIEAVRVFTRSAARARAFYAEKLGLVPTFTGETLSIFDTGQAKLVLEQCEAGDAETDDLVGRFLGFSFAVADIEATVAELSARGVIFDGPPERQDWGGTLAHFSDPDGNILTLAQYPADGASGSSAAS